MRIHFVKKSRKEWRCSKCGGTIEIGSQYRWWKHRYRLPTRWHVHHGSPKSSDLTTSDKLSRVYAAQETVEDICNDLGSAIIEEQDHLDLVHELEELEESGEATDEEIEALKEQIQEELEGLQGQARTLCQDAFTEIQEQIEEAEYVADEYEESAENVREYFGDTYQTDEMDEKANYIREWKEEVEEAMSDLNDEDFEDCESADQITDKINDLIEPITSCDLQV